MQLARFYCPLNVLQGRAPAVAPIAAGYPLNPRSPGVQHPLGRTNDRNVVGSVISTAAVDWQQSLLS